MPAGQCHCGAIKYEVTGAPMHHALCHCSDCRRHSGAPMVGWMMFKSDQVLVKSGKPSIYHSSAHGRRHFCGACGTGLFYLNAEMLPGITDVQSATLDNPNAIPPEVQIQTADRLSWMTDLSNLPEFKHFPPQG
jgi:hypothetical protein